MLKKTVQFIETLYKGDIVVRDIRQPRSIFQHYKISNFSVIHSQNLEEPSANPAIGDLRECCQLPRAEKNLGFWKKFLGFYF